MMRAVHERQKGVGIFAELCFFEDKFIKHCPESRLGKIIWYSSGCHLGYQSLVEKII
jgi:hypothetical protein